MRPTRAKIARYIADQLHGGESPTKLAKEVAAYLLSEHRSSDLNSIMRDVIAIRASEGNVEAEVVVAHALETKVLKEIEKTVKSIRPDAKHITIEERIDPKLIGGIKLSVVDKSLDLSVRAKLNRLRALTSQGGA